MKLRSEIVAWVAMTVLLLALIAVSTLGFKGIIAAFVLAIGVTLVITFGPERTGTVVLIAALGFAPLNAFRPAGFVTFSDVCFVVGFGLLLPRLIRNRPTLPPTFYFGSTLFTIGGILACTLMPVPVIGLFGVLRFVVAAMALPFLMSLWRPRAIVITMLAAAYVGGQMVSTAYSFVRPIQAQGRSFGWTTHPDFFGLGGQISFALLVFLFYRLRPSHRWILLIPTAVVAESVLKSGSRASLLCVAIVVIAWPLVERTAITWYALISIGVIGVAVANPILGSAGESSALSRIQGGLSSSASDQARVQRLTDGMQQFLAHPFTGTGFSASTLDTHNAYLEAGIGGGLLALVGFAMIVVTLVAPLVRNGVPNRLAYVGLSYAVFAMIGPSLWDRIVWAALALVYMKPEDPVPLEPQPTSSELIEQGTHR